MAKRYKSGEFNFGARVELMERARTRTMRLRPLLWLCLAQPASGFQLTQSFQFDALTYTAGLYHIHSPAYCIEPHGFALPGFRIIGACRPRNMTEGVLSINFRYRTLFQQRSMRGRMFSESLHTSYVVLSDETGIPVVFASLSLKSGEHVVLQASGSLLRPPASPWERFMLCRGADQSSVERAVAAGYSDLKCHPNLKRYISMVLERERNRVA